MYVWSKNGNVMSCKCIKTRKRCLKVQPAPLFKLNTSIGLTSCNFVQHFEFLFHTSFVPLALIEYYHIHSFILFYLHYRLAPIYVTNSTKKIIQSINELIY